MGLIRLTLLLFVASLLTKAQSIVNNNAAGSATPYTIAAATSGNFLAGCFINRGTATTITSLSTTNITWTFVGRLQTGSMNVEVWWGKATGTGGTSVTITWGAGTSIAHQITEFSGVDTTSPVDGSIATNSGSGTTSTSGTYTSANANDLLFHCLGVANNTAPSAPTLSFNLLRGLGAGSSGTSRAVGDSYRVVSSATSYTTGFTEGNGAWGSVLIGFKAVNNAIPNKIYSYLRGVSRAAFYTFAVASLGWDCRSVIARVREILVQLRDAVEMALSRIAEMEMVSA